MNLIETPPKAEYLMGHSDHEMSNLQLQAERRGPITRRLPDIGRGTGDVSATAPELFGECLIGDAATSPITRWFAEAVRPLVPEPVASFGATKAETAIDTLADQLQAEAAGNAAQACSPRQICAWVRV